MKKFHVDIETTGTDPSRDQILQVAVLEVERYNSGLWLPGKAMEITIHTDREPTSTFDMENMRDLYAACKKVPYRTSAEIHGKILSFFQECGLKPGERAEIMGWNAAIFDLPFLEVAGYLEGPRRIHYTSLAEDREHGDYSHRVYDIQSVFQGMMDVTNLDRKALFDLIDAPIKAQLDDLPRHRALADCRRQTLRLNQMLTMMRSWLHRAIPSDNGNG